MSVSVEVGSGEDVYREGANRNEEHLGRREPSRREGDPERTEGPAKEERICDKKLYYGVGRRDEAEESPNE
jgi:hypothetical protein